METRCWHLPFLRLYFPLHPSYKICLSLSSFLLADLSKSRLKYPNDSLKILARNSDPLRPCIISYISLTLSLFLSIFISEKKKKIKHKYSHIFLQVTLIRWKEKRIIIKRCSTFGRYHRSWSQTTKIYKIYLHHACVKTKKTKIEFHIWTISTFSSSGNFIRFSSMTLWESWLKLFFFSFLFLLLLFVINHVHLMNANLWITRHFK